MKWPLSHISDVDLIFRVSISLLARALNVLQMSNINATQNVYVNLFFCCFIRSFDVGSNGVGWTG